MKGLIEMLQNHSIHFCLLFQRRDLFGIYESPLWASLVAQWLKKKKQKTAFQCKRHEFDPWVGEIPWRRKWQPSPVFLPGKIPQTEEPGELQSMESQELDMT